MACLLILYVCVTHGVRKWTICSSSRAIRKILILGFKALDQLMLIHCPNIRGSESFLSCSWHFVSVILPVHICEFFHECLHSAWAERLFTLAQTVAIVLLILYHRADARTGWHMHIWKSFICALSLPVSFFPLCIYLYSCSQVAWQPKPTVL